MTKEAFVALVTCFNDDETVNYAATRAQVRRQVAAGNNIMCAGTNGDFTALTFEEKVRLCGEVVDEVGGKASIIVNAGMPATFETILLAREFEKIGVDGIAVITPFFIQVTQDGLIRHFSAGRRRGHDAGLPLRHPGAHPEPHRAGDREDPRRAWQHRRDQGLGRGAGDARGLPSGRPRGSGIRGLLRPRPPGALGVPERRQGLHLRPRQRHARDACRHRPGLQRRRHSRGRERRRRPSARSARTSTPSAIRRRW